MSSEPAAPATSQPVIEAQGLGKRYELFERPSDRLKSLLWGRWRAYGQPFWALQGVDFTLHKGEVLGVIGRNGAGKSTLLQIICGTVSPTVGRLTVRGRIAALLELGAGFNPDFSGLENVYFNAALLGLGRAEVDARLDDILAFADIGDFVHQPVKTYSSGMFVRLAFAVATSIDPDVLVIDEALSVGDGAFARKSFDRVMALKEKGASILFCSHSMYHIQTLCRQALWLEGGQVRLLGPAAKVTSAYESALLTENASPSAQAAAPTPQEARPTPSATALPVTETARLCGIEAWSTDPLTGEMQRSESKRLALASMQSDLEVRVSFVSSLDLPPPTVAFVIEHQNGVLVTSGITLTQGHTVARGADGHSEVRLHIPKVPLLQGDYHMDIYLGCERGLQLYDHAMKDIFLAVNQSSVERGLVMVPHVWTNVQSISRENT